jgi:replicative DNA helicase
LIENPNIDVILENEIIHNLLNNKEYFNAVIFHLQPEFFSDPSMALIFSAIKDFYLEYQRTPQLKEIILSFKDDKKQNKELIKENIKNVILKENINTELLTKLTENFIKSAIFTKAIVTGADALSEHNQDKMKNSY